MPLLAEALPPPTSTQWWDFCVSAAALIFIAHKVLQIVALKQQMKQGTAESPHILAQPVQVAGQIETRHAISHASEDDLAELTRDVQGVKNDIGEMKLAAVKRTAEIKEAFRAEADRLIKETNDATKRDFRDAFQRMNDHGEKIAAHEKELELLRKGWRS